MVTSCRPSEGKSTTALTLAKNHVAMGLQVLIVDADLRNPSLHRALKTDNSFGLSNYLSGGCKAEDALQATGIPNLIFMASGPLPPNPAELLAGPRLQSLLSFGSEEFDLVIIDAPPVLGLADAPLLASAAAGTLLVVAASQTRTAPMRLALKRLRFARAYIVGAVLSKFDSKNVGYGYSYGYGYGDREYYAYGSKPARIAAFIQELIDGQERSDRKGNQLASHADARPKPPDPPAAKRRYRADSHCCRLFRYNELKR